MKLTLTLLVWLVSCQAVWAACTIDTTMENTAALLQQSHSFSMSIANQANRYLGCFFTTGNTTDVVFSNGAFNGDAMLSRGVAIVDQSPSLYFKTEYFDMVAPDVGTFNVTVTSDIDTRVYPVCFSIYGVDQTTPRVDVDNSALDSSAASSSLTLTDDANCFVIDMLSSRDTATGVPTGQGADQTVQQSQEPFSLLDVAASSQSGTADGVMSWSWTSAGYYTHVAVALSAAVDAAPEVSSALY